MTKKNIKTQILTHLEDVMDPELNISVVDLGLIYGVELKDSQVKIIMTLTSIGCPLFSIMENLIKSKVQKLGFKEKNIEIELTFDPPWSMDRMTERGKAILGI